MFKKLFISKRISIFFAAILLVNLLVGTVVLAKINTSLNTKIIVIKEEQRPANLDIVTIKNSDCLECFDVDKAVKAIKENNVNILSEKSIEYNSSEAQKLIAEYKIKTIPSFIVRGELNKDQTVQKLLEQLGEIKDNSFVANKLPAPYFSIDVQKILGNVKIVMLTDDTCQECYDVESHKNIMKSFGIYIAEEEKFSIQSVKGRELMNKYNIKLLPTIILTGDTGIYKSLTNVWTQVGTIENDQAMVFRNGVKGMGIYKDLKTNQIINPADAKQVKK